jgi:hypothetical protein
MYPLNGVSCNIAVYKNVNMTLIEDLLCSLKQTKRRGKFALHMALKRCSLKSSIFLDVMPSRLVEMYHISYEWIASIIRIAE